MITITTYVEINGEFNESYEIVIPYRELEIHIVEHMYFPAINPFLSDWVTYSDSSDWCYKIKLMTLT